MLNPFGTIFLVFGIAASVVVAIAETHIARTSGDGHHHMGRAGGAALLALICALCLAKGNLDFTIYGP